MRSLLVLLTVLLAALPAHAVRYRVTPGGALGGVVATDWHAASDLADIRAGTATTVVNTAWLREAVTAACLTDTRTLYMPGGRYPMPAAAVASVGPPGGGGIGCDGLRIICSEGSQRGDGAIFYVTENRIGIQSTRDAMIYVNRANWFSIRGCAFAGQNFYGDGLRIEENAWVDVSDNYFANFKGSEYSEITSVNTGTDTLTKESSISSDNIVLGGRIEFEVYSGPTGGLPGGITIRTPYWVSFKSGHSFRISATPGGSDVNISSVGGKFYVLFDTITFDDTDLDLATDTFTMENHPFENGFKVEFSRSTAPTENGKAGTAFSTPLWVTNSTEDSFQLMDEPTGATIVDWVSDGGTNQKISASYAALRGGGNVYCTFNNNHISGRAIGVSILATENEAGAAPYGCNVYDFTNNHLNAGVRFDGAGNVHKNSFESALPYPLSAYLRIGGSASYSYVTGNYFEAQSKPVAAIGISFSGQNTGTAAIIRNYMFGGSATEVGTYGIDVGTANGAPILIGNHITSWANCVGATYSHNRLASSMFIGNTCGSTSVDGIQTPTEENQGAGRDPAFWQYSIAGFFAFLGGQVRMPVVTVDNATTLNLSEGNHWLLTQNDYPYPDTDTHLLLIHRRHAEKFSDISREAQLELFALATETETHGYFTGGGLCVRVGDPLRSGASVKHLHFHLICPRRGGKQIKFTMGSTER